MYNASLGTKECRVLSLYSGSFVSDQNKRHLRYLLRRMKNHKSLRHPNSKFIISVVLFNLNFVFYVNIEQSVLRNMCTKAVRKQTLSIIHNHPYRVCELARNHRLRIPRPNCRTGQHAHHRNKTPFDSRIQWPAALQATQLHVPPLGCEIQRCLLTA